MSTMSEAHAIANDPQIAPSEKIELLEEMGCDLQFIADLIGPEYVEAYMDLGLQ